VVDVEGCVLRRDVVASDPDVLAKWLGKHAKNVARVVLERGVPVICICANKIISRRGRRV
jgi:hypothetical protein